MVASNFFIGLTKIYPSIKRANLLFTKGKDCLSINKGPENAQPEHQPRSWIARCGKTVIGKAKAVFYAYCIQVFKS